MYVLGIESSCDETGAAVVQDGQRVLSNIVATQIPIHARYGGVVPELASRNHVIEVIPVVQRALEEAGVGLADLDGIAVTQGPGLVGALLVGIEVAKALAYSHNLPLVGVNHIEAHLLAILLDDPAPDVFPFVGLVVSGGHTSLIRVDGVGQYKGLGQTRDDAAGEALDKVGKRLGLGYPGGVYIDRLSTDGNPAAVAFPRAMRRRGVFEFSFSGLKTAVMTHINRLPSEPEGATLHDICASVQEAVVDTLVEKTLGAAKQEGVEWVVISGGVSANSRLRERIQTDAAAVGLRVAIPPRSLCTDNAAMIAGLGTHLLRDAGEHFNAFALDARASWPVA